MTVYERVECPRKPKRCPVCGHATIASILYGLPDFDEQLAQRLEAGKIVLGGCCLFGDEPRWECTSCGQPLHKKSA